MALPATGCRRRRSAQLGRRWDPQVVDGVEDICRNTDVRTVIAGVVPGWGRSASFTLFASLGMSRLYVPISNPGVTSLAFDYVNATEDRGYVDDVLLSQQLPVLPPAVYREIAAGPPERPWLSGSSPRSGASVAVLGDAGVRPRCCYDGPPFVWDEQRFDYAANSTPSSISTSIGA